MDNKEEKKIIRQEFQTGERALFMGKNLDIYDTIFDDGESPLKESCDINLYGSMFKWKYPLWYSKNIVAEDCHWFEMARAGVWYTDNIAVRRALIQAPKNFRRCKGLELTDVTFTHAEETLWSCDDMGTRHLLSMEPHIPTICEFKCELIVLDIILAHIHMESIAGYVVQRF